MEQWIFQRWRNFTCVRYVDSVWAITEVFLALHGTSLLPQMLVKS